MSFTGLQVTGIKELQEVLSKVTPRHAKNLMRNTVRAVAADIRKDIMKNAPTATGNMAKAKNIRVKMRRAIESAQVAEVVFDFKSFYWRFVEHGTAGQAGSPSQPFVYPARNRALSQLDKSIYLNFSLALEKTMKRELKKQAKAKRDGV